MNPISAPDVDTYIENAPEERRAVLRRFQALCRTILIDFEETMAFQVPSYRRNGAVEVVFASQKYFIALYILRQTVLEPYRAYLKGQSLGPACIRFTKPERVDFELVEQLLRDTQAASGPLDPPIPLDRRK